MPQFSGYTQLAAPVAEIFAFFLHPANALLLKPPDLSLELVEGPERLHLGTRTTWKLRRWGVSQRLVQEVIELEENQALVEKQVQGPFALWVHSQRFESLADSTRLAEQIDFEPPPGILGRLVTAAKILADLEAGFAHRQRCLRERFGAPAT